MTDPVLPADMKAALARLQEAVTARIRAVQDAATGPASAEPDEDLGAEVAALQAELESLKTENTALKAALNDAESRRGQALRKVDDATSRVDDLLSVLESGTAAE